MRTVLPIQPPLSEPKLVIGLIEGGAGALSRRGLAKKLCLELDLKDGKGDFQMATTSKALRELEEEGLWTLPKPRFSMPRSWNPARLNQPVSARAMDRNLNHTE